MAKLRIVCDGFDMAMEFDPSSEDDCEIVAEAFLLLHRRYKATGVETNLILKDNNHE
jgi:hypothetical protein